MLERLGTYFRARSAEVYNDGERRRDTHRTRDSPYKYLIPKTPELALHWLAVAAHQLFFWSCSIYQ